MHQKWVCTLVVRRRSCPLTIQPVSISQRSLECVEDFLYLGSYTSNQADIDVDIRARLSKVASVFQRLHSICTSHSISNSIKFHLYAFIVLSTALHARETWKFTARIRNTLDVFHRRCIRKTLELMWQDRIATEECMKRTVMHDLSEIVRTRSWSITC